MRRATVETGSTGLHHWYYAIADRLWLGVFAGVAGGRPVIAPELELAAVLIYGRPLEVTPGFSVFESSDSPADQARAGRWMRDLSVIAASACGLRVAPEGHWMVRADRVDTLLDHLDGLARLDYFAA